MAYTTGTAADYKDLLSVMVAFASANGWAVLDQTDVEAYLKGPGENGLDEIYVGVRTFEVSSSNRYNWQLYGSWGFRSGVSYPSQPHGNNARQPNKCYAYLWNDPMPYWMVCNGRRIIIVAKVGSTYEWIHLGLITVLGTEAQFPYPLLVGGSSQYSDYSYATQGSRYSFWFGNVTYSGSNFHLPSGLWTPVRTGNNAAYSGVGSMFRSDILNSPDGEYPLWEIYLYQWDEDVCVNLYGKIEGVYRVSGYNNTAENIITVDGINYLVAPHIWRVGFNDFAVLRLT